MSDLVTHSEDRFPYDATNFISDHLRTEIWVRVSTFLTRRGAGMGSWAMTSSVFHPCLTSRCMPTLPVLPSQRGSLSMGQTGRGYWGLGMLLFLE